MARLLVVFAPLAALAILAPIEPAVLAKDEPASYPEGASVQTFAARRFELFVPKAADSKPPWSLVIVLDGDYDVEKEYGDLAKDGYVVCSPKPKLKGGMFATSEADEILDLRDQLERSLPIAKDRMHVVTISETHGISSFVAFNKRANAVSLVLVKTFFQGKAPPADAKKRLGVLSLGKPDAAYGDPARSIAALGEKVRTVEYRPDDGVAGPYFAYWLGVMDGRYEPGRDLSFGWIADATPPAPGAAKPDRSMPTPTPPVPALTAAKEAAKAKHASVFVYFWSADDAVKSEGRSLQNSVFFDAEVRGAAKPLVAVKLDRAKYGEVFTQMGLTSTPAVAVVDVDFNVLDRFEGAVKAPLLAKALARAAGPAKPK